MLSFSNVTEAITWLSRHTGQDWTVSRLFEVAAARSIALHAAVPPGVTTVTTRRASDSTSYLEDIPDHPLALLNPKQVRRLGLAGVAETNLAAAIDGELGEYSQLSSPIRVTTSEVRVSTGALQEIATAVKAAEASTAGVKPVPRAVAQDATILKEIESLGISPTSLPPPVAGKMGVKGLVAEALLSREKRLFGSKRVFDHAWQRLRTRGEVANAAASD
jgi:hypothetical protein